MIIIPPPLKYEVGVWLRQHFGEPSPHHPFVHARSRHSDQRYALGDGHSGDPPGIYRVWIRDKEDRALFTLRWSAELKAVKP